MGGKPIASSWASAAWLNSGKAGSAAKRCHSSVTSPVGSVRSSFTWCVSGEFCLVGLKAFSQVLVKYDNVTVRKDDWDVFLAHILGLFSDRRDSEMLSDTYQV